MTVEHCAEISHAVSALLDVADPIAGSLPARGDLPRDRPAAGTGAPISSVFAGFEARVETARCRSRVGVAFAAGWLGVVDDEVCLRLPEGEQTIPCAGIKKAKLVLTDDLLAAAQTGAKELSAW